MWNPRPFVFLLDPSLTISHRCLSCQFRALRPNFRIRNASSSPNYTPKHSQKRSLDSLPTQPEAPNKANIPEDDFTPKPLNRPLGLPYPPLEGQNTGVDKRSLQQRRDDFVNYGKHIERRKELTKQVTKPYFRDWTTMRHHKGKNFLSNDRLFKADKALYFPNLYGRTLSSPKSPQNTTPVLRGKISILSLFSSLWAERQVLSFVGLKQNPGLHEIIREAGGLVQRVEINVEDNWLKAWLIRMFMWRTRRKMPQEQHGRYFLVKKGFTESLGEQIGVMNSKVGYVYLLDDECKIRWAGSSIAESRELEALNTGIRKLVKDKKRGLPLRSSELTCELG